MKKNGFISTTLIYTFFTTFLLLLLFLLNNYSRIRFLLDEYKIDIKDSILDEDLADINVYIYIYNEDTKDYDLKEELPGFNYYIEKSICNDPNSKVSVKNGIISVETIGREECYVYFRELKADITLNIYSKVSDSDPNPVLEKKVPDIRYDFKEIKCRSGNVTFDSANRKFLINSSTIVDCDAYFIRKDADIELHIFELNSKGEQVYQGLNYEEVKNIPKSLTYVGYECNPTVKSFNYTSGEFEIKSDVRSVCNVYFK